MEHARKMSSSVEKEQKEEKSKIMIGLKHPIMPNKRKSKLNDQPINEFSIGNNEKRQGKIMPARHIIYNAS